MRGFLFAAVLGLAAVPGPVAAAGPNDPPGPSLSGRVTAQGGTPLAEVRVSIAEASRSATTDANGYYEFANLPGGTFSVSFALVGYAPEVRRVTLRNAAVTLDIAMRPSVVELSELQVTATPLATTPLTSPQPTAILGGADLRVAQAPTLGETLEGVAGVHNLSTGPGIGKPVIRGLTSNRVLVLDDGVRLETSQWGDEHGPQVSTSEADRIEVIRGPASVMYGSDALGGVINVVPKELPDAIGRSGFAGGNFSAAYNSNNRQPDGALLLEGASGGFGFRGTVSGHTSSDVRTPDYTLWNSEDRAGTGSAALGYRGTWGSVAGTYTHREERIQLTDEDSLATPLQRIAEDRGRIDTRIPFGLNRLEATLSYERNRRREFEEEDSPDVALGLLSQNWLADLKLHHAPLGNLAGVVGISGWRTTFEKFGEETLIPDNRANNFGVYAFEQLETGRWSFSAGGRYDYRHLDVSQDDALGVAAQTHTYNSISGNVGALYRVAEPVALVLNLGHGFRAPSAFDLFSNGVHEGTVAFERGDPNLKNEKSFNTDLAVRVQSRTLSLEVGAFANLVQDFIFTEPVPGEIDPESGFQVFQTTKGDATMLGFEGAVDFHPTSFLHLHSTADYVHGQNTTTDTPLPNMPPFRATYTARLEGSDTKLFASPYFFVGGETNARQGRLDPAEAQFFSEAFDGAGYQSEAYTLVNFGAGFGLPAGKRPVRFDFTLRNAFNKAYADFLSRIKTNALNPAMGRALIARVSTDF
jgi:iron complex outermembrane recepter protein